MKKELVTLQDALEAGYKYADMQCHMGYVTRKERKPSDIPLYTAGGSRKGELYVLLPNWNSTRFCFRQYLVAPEK